MTPWQKFKKVSWELCKDLWVLPFLLAMYIPDEFNAKLKPPFPIAFLVFVLSATLTGLLFFPSIVFFITVVIIGSIYKIIHGSIVGTCNWIRRINTNAY